MAKNYDQHVADLREKIASEGLSRALREALSAIPAAIGHLLDTLLKLDGLILKDRENYLDGPFGFLFGISFVIIGALIGKLADILLAIPSYLGYYVFDRIINYFSPGFNKVMVLDDPSQRGGIAKFILVLTYFYYTYLTQPPPKEMGGLFGFLLGVIPQTVNYIAQRVSATLTALVHYTTTSSCAAIRDFYGSVSTPAESNDQPPPQRRSRVKRLNESDTVDLFAALEITRESYSATDAASNVEKAFKKLSVKYHPDRHQQANPTVQKEMKDKFALIQRARTVLTDPNSSEAKRYLSIYDSQHAFFAHPAPEIVAEEAANTHEASGGRTRFKRPPTQ
jgi:hypothetical protein